MDATLKHIFKSSEEGNLIVFLKEQVSYNKTRKEKECERK